MDCKGSLGCGLDRNSNLYKSYLRRYYMLKLLAFKDAYLNNEEGATAIEYGLIAAAIALGIVAIVFTLGDQITAAFTGVSTTLAAEGVAAAP